MIAFDLDDTLFLELDFLHSGYRAIGRLLETRGVMPAQEVWELLMSSEVPSERFDILSAHLATLGVADEFPVKWMVDTYRYHIPHIELLPGAFALLQALRQEGETLALVTDGRSRTQRAKIGALCLREFFHNDNILISEDVGADKTTPVPFRLLMERFPGEERYVYVGDNPAKDFLWPNRLGWITVQLLHPEGESVHPSRRPDLPAEYQPQYRVNSLAELIPLLAGNSKHNQ